MNVFKKSTPFFNIFRQREFLTNFPLYVMVGCFREMELFLSQLFFQSEPYSHKMRGLGRYFLKGGTPPSFLKLKVSTYFRPITETIIEFPFSSIKLNFRYVRTMYVGFWKYIRGILFSISILILIFRLTQG